MSIGWFKKWTIERTTKEIIKGIAQKVDATLRINPDLTLEEALRLVDKNRGIFFPDEESFTTDLQSLFVMMVWKVYRYERASDRDASSKEHAELVIGIANDYMSTILLKTKDDYENRTTYPNHAKDYINQGLAYYNLGQPQRAIEDFNKAIRLKPDLAAAYYARGGAYADLGQYQRAIEDYNQAIRLKPDVADAYYDRGIAYVNLGQYERAIEDFNQAVHLQPDYAIAYFNRGTAYANLGQQQRAIEDYNKAISLKPDLAMAYYNRGNTYADLGQYQRAIEDYNEAIRLKPDNTDAYINRGGVYFMQDNNKLGCRDAQKACELGNCKLLDMAKGKGLCR